MDGSRGIRASGTDGSDHSVRMRLDDRYHKMAAAKTQLGYVRYAGFAVGLAIMVFHAILPMLKTNDTRAAIVPSMMAALMFVISNHGKSSAEKGVGPAVSANIIIMSGFALILLGMSLYSLFGSVPSLSAATLYALGGTVCFLGAHASNTLKTASNTRRS